MRNPRPASITAAAVILIVVGCEWCLFGCLLACQLLWPHAFGKPITETDPVSAIVWALGFTALFLILGIRLLVGKPRST